MLRSKYTKTTSEEAFHNLIFYPGFYFKYLKEYSAFRIYYCIEIGSYYLVWNKKCSYPGIISSEKFQDNEHHFIGFVVSSQRQGQSQMVCLSQWCWRFSIWLPLRRWYICSELVVFAIKHQLLTWQAEREESYKMVFIWIRVLSAYIMQ